MSRKPQARADRLRTSLAEFARCKALLAGKFIHPGTLNGQALYCFMSRAGLDMTPRVGKRALDGLLKEGLLERRVDAREKNARLTPWRSRSYRLTGAGVAAADGCLRGRRLAV